MSVSSITGGGGSHETGLPIRDLECKADEPPREPEVRVEVKDREKEEWVRIPVVNCELTINKDGPAAITRTAKVKFPGEWGGESIAQHINGMTDRGDNSYDECRILFYDREYKFYQIAHYGYVGGVGPATQNGVMKMWVYDAADLMRRIPVSKSFGDPTIQQVLGFILNGIDDKSRPVGLERRSVFDNIQTYVTGEREVELAKKEQRTVNEPDDDDLTVSVGTPVGPFQINVEDIAGDIRERVFGSDVTSSILNTQKQFKINRHNMVDLLDWFTEKIGGKWHFEPTPEGLILFFDNTSQWHDDAPTGALSRRLFVEEEVDDPLINDSSIFTTVNTVHNDALVDIKPFNKLVLYGAATQYKGTDEYNSGVVNENPGNATFKQETSYPYVEVTYPPLLERSGGYEYTAPPQESDVTSLDRAKSQAVDEFRKFLSEKTEGEIILKGEPHILPFDEITTIPACNTMFPDANFEPITYEVNSVTHRRGTDKPYITEIGVSMTVHESELNVEAHMQSVE